MTNYHYVGQFLDGRPASGATSARDHTDLELKLLKTGILLREWRPSLNWLQQAYYRNLKRQEVTKVTRQISLLLKSQVSVLESLSLAREQLTDKLLAQCLANVMAEVEAGKSLAMALSDFPFLFDELYLSMVEAGELSGTLDAAFDRIASYREKHEATTRKVKSALAYPLLVVAVAIAVVFALILYVVPVFSTMYESFGAELPTLTQSVVRASDLLKGTMWLWSAGVVLGAALVLGLVQSGRGRLTIHRLILQVPFIRRLFTKIVTARFCRTMGALLSSGVDIIASLEIASHTTGNLFAGLQLRPSALLLAQGKSLTESLEASSLFPRAMLRLTASGEKTGRLGEMLTRAAEYYESESDSEITTLTTLAEPVIIILLGLFIAFILVAMYLPLFELVGSL